jgi:magnesium-protoporphyrin O-methyltransferase
MECCRSAGIERHFDGGWAAKELARYRRRGPLPTTRLLVDAIRTSLEPGDTLLDVGGGVGAVHHELLDDGVRSATNVDISAASLAAAAEEAARRGHARRVRLLPGDFVELATSIDAADVVTLDRVICCYPDMERLVSLSAAKARRLYGAVYPRDVWWVRLVVAAENVVNRLRGSPFRAYVHAPRGIAAVLQRAGFEAAVVRRRLAWEVVVCRRLARGSDAL